MGSGEAQRRTMGAISAGMAPHVEQVVDHPAAVQNAHQLVPRRLRVQTMLHTLRCQVYYPVGVSRSNMHRTSRARVPECT